MRLDHQPSPNAPAGFVYGNWSPAPSRAFRQVLADRIRVCVVDGDRSALLGLVEVLRNAAGFECVGCFSDPEEALARIPRLQPHIVLIDHRMPELSGLNCIRRLRQTAPMVKCLLVSAFCDDLVVREAMQLQASGVLCKPFSSETLLDALRAAAHGGVYVDGHLRPKLTDLWNAGMERTSEALALLTPREWELVELQAHGLQYKEMADRLKISERTVNNHLANVRQKLGAQKLGRGL